MDDLGHSSQPPGLGRATVLGLGRLREQLSGLADADAAIDALLQRAGVQWTVDEARLSALPDKGGLVVVCDQNFGTLQALVVYQLLRRRRPEVRLFGHRLLADLPHVSDVLHAIEPGWQLSGRVQNVLSLKAALGFIEQGGAVGILPTAETAALDGQPWHVVDPTWDQTLGDVLAEHAITALPISFTLPPGGLPSLSALLSGETVTPGPARSVRVELGQAVRGADLQKLTAGAASPYLRDRSAILALGAQGTHAARPAVDQSGYAPVAEAEDPAAIAAEIAALPADQKLVENRGRIVCYARGNECPRLLQEIGRLRQIAFRAVGEGTAEPRDLDRFDHYYDHLFVWNEATSEVIGAYRLGRLDALPQGEAPYSSTLFEYTPAFFERLGPAVELGRSFVRPEYQRSPAGLIMLWKGIGAYLCNQPRYRFLLGPVSMSADYSITAQQLMVAYMEQYAAPDEWAGSVIPRTPFDPQGERHALWKRFGRWCPDFTELNRWVSHIEGGQRGVPVLIKSYLGLAGRMLAFNVDPDFGDCIDGLVLVDLTLTPVSTLEAFMGQRTHTFLSNHPPSMPAPPAEGGADTGDGA